MLTKPDLVRPVADLPIFRTEGRDRLFVRAGTTAAGTAFDTDTPVAIEPDDLVAGADFAIVMVDGALGARPCLDGVPDDAIGGFHFAPGGNATARDGGDGTPAINPCSIWDVGFKPACADPRGMAFIDMPGNPFWADVYLLGTDHVAKGTSCNGETIADGHKNLPNKAGGGQFKKIDYPTTTAIYADHGKQLLTYDEFRAAAVGVTEKSSADNKPKVAGLDAARTSQFGLMQATGNMWVWGTDGDPDDPRPSVFGGSWICGVSAGSRYAGLVSWPEDSNDSISARGRCGHLVT